MLQEKGEKVWKMWCAYWSPAEQTHLKNVFFTTENNGKPKCQNALTAIIPSALFKALAKAGKREEREEDSVNYGTFSWKSVTSLMLLLDNGGPQSSRSWSPTALWPTGINRAGRIILMLLVNCSQITALEAQLWFYNVQLPCVTWGWCFQETGALMECLCSGSSKVLSLYWMMEYLFYIESINLGWHEAEELHHHSTSPDLHYRLALWPHQQKSLHWGVFLSGQNWRLKSFWQICHFFLVLKWASKQLLSFLLWTRACWRSLLVVLAWQMWYDQLSFMQVKFSPQI